MPIVNRSSNVAARRVNAILVPVGLAIAMAG